MVDDEDIAVGLAHSVQLAEQASGLLHHGHHVHRHHLVEAAVGKVHGVRIHLVQALDIGEPAPPDAHARLVEHLAREVDAGDAHERRVQRQREAGADTDFQHALAGAAFEDFENRLAPRLQHRTEQGVVDTCVPPVSGLYGFDLHGLLFIAIDGPGTTIARLPRSWMKIAQVAPLAVGVPPQDCGGIERVVAYLTDELARRRYTTVYRPTSAISTAR